MLAAGAKAPAFRLRLLGGGQLSLDEMIAEGPVLLAFYKGSCPVCQFTIPYLERLKSGAGLRIYLISQDDEKSTRGFMKDFQMTFPIWRDPDERISTQFLAVGVPATFLIDRDGILRWRKTGPIAPNDTSLTAAIERTLGS